MKSRRLEAGWGRVSRPKYKAMVAFAKRALGQFAETPGPFGVTAQSLFALSRIRVGEHDENVRTWEAEAAWPAIVEELKLVKDGLGSWTLPGREMDPTQVENALKIVTQRLQ